MILKKIKTIWEDDQAMAIAKPAGADMATVKQQFKKLKYSPAHRLDKDTSGLLILAKNKPSFDNIQKQFKERKVIKKYQALALGEMPERGAIEGYLTRDASRKKPFIFSRLAIGSQRGKWRWSKSRWQKIKGFVLQKEKLSLVEVSIFTGRTHQIRIHLLALGFPILGDKVYNTKKSREISRKLGAKRQLLHACQIKFVHPVTKKTMELEDNLPKDFTKILNLIAE